MLLRVFYFLILLHFLFLDFSPLVYAGEFVAHVETEQSSNDLDRNLINKIFRKPFYFGSSLMAETMKRAHYLYPFFIEHFALEEYKNNAPSNDGGNPVHLAFEKMTGSTQSQYFLLPPYFSQHLVWLFTDVVRMRYDYHILDCDSNFVITNCLSQMPRKSLLGLDLLYFKHENSFNELFNELINTDSLAINIASPFSSPVSYAGYQVHQLFAESSFLHPFYESASILAALDLFYWEGMNAFKPNPGYGYVRCDEYFKEYTRKLKIGERLDQETGRVEDIEEDVHLNIHHIIPHLVQKSFQDGKVLILGTVPEDGPEFVNMSALLSWLPDSLSFLKVPIFDFPEDNFACIKDINSVLKKECTADRNCYLVDLHRIVDDLQNGHLIDIFGERASKTGREGYNYDEHRGKDGVHLTHTGSKMIANIIQGLLQDKPPFVPEIPINYN